MDDHDKVIRFPAPAPEPTIAAELPLTVLKAALAAAQPLASAEKIERDYEAFRDRMLAAMQRVVEYRDRQWDEALDRAIPDKKRVVRLALPGQPH